MPDDRNRLLQRYNSPISQFRRGETNRLMSYAPPEPQGGYAMDNLNTLLEWLPGTGEAAAARDAMDANKRAADDLQSGDYWGALSNYGDMALGLLGAVPLLGMAGRAARRGRGAFEIDYFGQPVRILENPSPQETKGFLNRTKYKAARRIVDPDTGDAYIWDANDPAMHELVAEKLGIDPKRVQGDMIGLD